MNLKDLLDRGIISADIAVAIQIYQSQPCWFRKLVEDFEGILDKGAVSHSITTCCDWGIVEGYYGETTPGKAGRLFRITHWSVSMVEGVIDKVRDA